MKRKLLFILSIILLQSCFLTAQNQNIDLNKNLKLSRDIRTGKLANGLTYYIRKNKKPENRAELRLAVNAGSILEDDDQQGLAHFTEHMGFNGTKNFKKQEMVNFLESIGMKFGPEVNAYTSFDETVYMIQVPTDTMRIYEKSFQILGDWAHNVSFDSSEIDKERGVIIEEWRLGRGASARMRDEQLPIIFKNSRYADRLTIGKKDILESFKYNTLRKFYKDWYRPDLEAVIVVGDVDVDKTEQFIKKYFNKIPVPKNEKERFYASVPDHMETYYAIASDKEASFSAVSVYYLHNIEPEVTVNDYRKSIIEAIYNGMFNQRLYELTKQANPPFVGAYSGNFDIVRTKEAYALSAQVKDNGIDTGLKTLLTEAERIKKFGFTSGELERQKKNMLRWMEKAYNERDKTDSRGLADELVRNFLDKEPAPGIEREYELYKELLPGISLDEVNKIANDFITDKNRVVLVNSPEKEGIQVPSKEELQQIINGIDNEKITAYKDELSSEDLLSKIPEPAEITNESKIDEIGVTELQLSNGVKVVLKPTDFKNDEILFTAISPGGNSLAPDSNFISASAAVGIVNESGVGKFSPIEMQKMLAGKVVGVHPWISEEQEGLSGSASPTDMESMFKLIYLYFTSPRIDSTAFESYMTKNKTYYENQSSDPGWAFQDTIQSVISNYNFRYQPWTTETLNKIDLNTAMNFYKNRFADASDFTFIFVGNFDIEKIKPYLKTYLGGLPSTNRKETWKDVGLTQPKGVIIKEVKKGIEPKSQVYISFPGKFDWSDQNVYNIRALTSILQIKLREVIREDKSGTYGISVYSSVDKYPEQTYNLNLTFGCDPKRVEELIGTVFNQIDSMKNVGPSDIYINKIKEQQLRSREVDLKTNSIWLNSLTSSYTYNEDPRRILTNSKMIENLNKKDVQDAAIKYFDMNNYVEVILYPQSKID